MDKYYTKICNSLPQQLSFSNDLPSARQFLWPLLLADEETAKRMQIAGNHFFQVILSEDDLAKAAEMALALSLAGILLYEKPKKQSADASTAFDSDSALIASLRYLKQNFPELVVAADLCVCQYTVNGHCRFDLNSTTSTEDCLIKLAFLYKECGADILMPSGMIPDFSNKLKVAFKNNNTPCPLIYSQSAKYSSALYSPFRGSLNICREIDKSSYQIKANDIKSGAELLFQEIPSGADICLIKPAIPYFLEVFEDLNSLAKDHDHSIIKCGAFITSGEHHYLLTLGRSVDAELGLFASAISALHNYGSSLFVTYIAPDIVRYFNKL